jgi:hypothetical protein
MAYWYWVQKHGPNKFLFIYKLHYAISMTFPHFYWANNYEYLDRTFCRFYDQAK